MPGIVGVIPWLFLLSLVLLFHDLFGFMLGSVLFVFYGCVFGSFSSHWTVIWAVILIMALNITNNRSKTNTAFLYFYVGLKFVNFINDFAFNYLISNDDDVNDEFIVKNKSAYRHKMRRHLCGKTGHWWLQVYQSLLLTWGSAFPFKLVSLCRLDYHAY